MIKWYPLLFLFLIPFAYSTEYDIITFTNTEIVYLDVFCENGQGNFCNASYDCLLTVYTHNWTLNYSNLNMSYVNNGFYNSSLGVYSETGDYKGFIVCVPKDGSGNNGSARSDFRVVEDTLQNEIRGADSMLALIITIFVLGGFFFFLAYVNEAYYVKMLSYFIAFSQLIIALGVTYGHYANIDFTLVLKINFYFIFILGGILAMYTLTMFSFGTFGAMATGKRPKWDKMWK